MVKSAHCRQVDSFIDLTTTWAPGTNHCNYIHIWLQDYLTNITESGGNSIRVWLFVWGDYIPLWDEETGFVLGTDSADTLIDELDR